MANDPKEHETFIQKQNGLSEDGDDVAVRPKDAPPSVLYKLKHDEEYRLKFITFICLVWSFFILGWILNQFGPSLFDLQLLTNTDLEESSYFYTSHNIGYLTGSLACGVLIGRFDCNLLLFITMTMYGASAFVIPWCFRSWAMLIAQGIRGLAGGLLDTIANSELLTLFGNEVSPYMQAMHFAFAVGGIVSPLATAPFLAIEDKESADKILNKIYETTTNLTSIQFQNQSMYSTISSMNITETKLTSVTREESNIYIPYCISGVIAWLSAISFLAVYVKSRSLSKKLQDHQETTRNERKLSRFMKFGILTIMSVIFLLYTAMEDTVGTYLATFCVYQMDMSKSEGSYVTALFWSFFAFGRLLGVVVGKLVRTMPLVAIYSTLLMLSFLFLSFAPSIHSSTTVWVSTGFSGFAMSILFPVMFTWTEEDFLLVTGKIASLFIVTSTLGSIGSPSLLGYLMEEVNPMWYAYILLVESAGMIIFFAIAVIIKKKSPEFQDSEFSDYKSNGEMSPNEAKNSLTNKCEENGSQSI